MRWWGSLRTENNESDATASRPSDILAPQAGVFIPVPSSSSTSPPVNLPISGLQESRQSLVYPLDPLQVKAVDRHPRCHLPLSQHSCSLQGLGLMMNSL